MLHMDEFFGFGGYKRPVEGYMSWQHLTFVSFVMAIMLALAIFFGLRNRHKDMKVKNLVLIVSGIMIDSFETLKIVIFCLREGSFHPILLNLPLYLCSIQLIMIPVAAFSIGRIKSIALDFVFIFGVIGCWTGTYFAAENYGDFPVLAFDNVVSAITHAISGFSALYIVISGMAEMKWKNLPWCGALIIFFCILAYIADVTVPYNYMFMISGKGTPYDILFNLVHGNPVAYPIGVALLFVIYIATFYGVYHLVSSFAKRRNMPKQA